MKSKRKIFNINNNTRSISTKLKKKTRNKTFNNKCAIQDARERPIKTIYK